MELWASNSNSKMFFFFVFNLSSNAKTCLAIKANKCFTSTSQPFAFLLRQAFPCSSAAPHLCDALPRPFSLRKACQRKSSQAEDIVERLWQPESHSNGSIMSLIMVWVSIIYQGWGPTGPREQRQMMTAVLLGSSMMSAHSQRWDEAGAEGGQAPRVPVSLLAGPWGLRHGQTCSSRSSGLENYTTGCFHGASAGSAATLTPLK